MRSSYVVRVNMEIDLSFEIPRHNPWLVPAYKLKWINDQRYLPPGILLDLYQFSGMRLSLPRGIIAIVASATCTSA